MMKKLLNQSFLRKLLLSFLLTGIVPLMVCSLLMTNIFKVTINREAGDAAKVQIASMAGSMDEFFTACEDITARLSADKTLLSALGSGGMAAQSMYYTLYDTTRELRGDAVFSVFDRDGRRIYTTASRDEPFYMPVDWGILKAAAASSGTVYRDVEDFGQEGGSICFRSALAVRYGGELLGYIVTSVGSDTFDRMFFGKYSTTGDILVVDSLWRHVYSSQPILRDELLPRLRGRLLSGEYITDSADCYYYAAPNLNSGFCLVMQQPKPLADGTMQLLYGITTSTIALCLILCTAFSVGMSRQFFEPVRDLNEAMIKVEKGNLDVLVESDRTDELGQLAGRFNRMVKKLRKYLEESLSRQKELNDTRIRMMQAQLNPHFLYNTLDTMKWIAKINHVPEVATMSADLADILRSSISGEEFVTLDYELKLLERYVEIQKIRFPDKFDFKVDVEDSVREVKVPKLMLQPLVENSIIHGFEDGSTGVITVCAQRVSDELVVTVKDDGCGIPEETMELLRTNLAPSKGHLGLHNVDAILRLHYGESRGIKFIPVRGHGTCIRIVLPIS